MTMKYGKTRAVLGGKVIGAVHIRQEKPCQDAVFVREENGVLFACVADGHGSASCPHSDEGAEAAVQTAAALLAQMLPDLQAHKDIRLPKMIEAQWKQEVEKIHSENSRENPPDGEPFPYILYGTTLVAAAATREFIFVLQIGDGDILFIDAEGNASPLLAEEEKIGEETESLCMDEAWAYIRTQIIPWNPANSPAMLMLCTDGYAKSFADGAGFLKAGTDIFRLCGEEGIEYVKNNLNDWLRSTSDKGSGDDIAMALMVLA